MKRAKEDNPFLAYRRQKELHDFLVKAKLKNPSQSNKTLSGNVHNDGHCCTCKFISHGTLSYTREKKEKFYKTSLVLLATFYA